MSADLVEASGRVLDAVVVQIAGSPRERQASMCTEGTAVLGDRQHLLVQAGTGTGKPAGYPVPLLTHCVMNGVRGVVSTATLVLQHQILVKDAPVVVDAVVSATGVRLKVVVLEGWSNYACPHKLDGGYPTEGTLSEDYDMSVDPTGELGKEILRIREWISGTTMGDRDDLVPGVSDRAWHHASIARPEYLGKHCPLIDEYFAQAIRLEAADADVVVTNHSLFGINACGEGELSGEYDAAVIDEAHKLADCVRSQTAADLTVARVSRVVRSLCSNPSTDPIDLDEARAGVDAAMSPLGEGLLEHRPSVLVDAMIVLDGAARRVSHEVSEIQGEPTAKLLARAAIDELIGTLNAWGRDPDQSIAYITKNGLDNARLTVGPLDVSAAISGNGIGEWPTILTSATLAIGGNFDFMAIQVDMAVSGVPWRGIGVGPPFDHGRQGIRHMVTHLPLPGRDRPSEELLDEFVELVQASDGGTLALFVSRRGAMAGAQALRERTDLTVYLQGEKTLAQLIRRFREEHDSCLVGTTSLWQGADVAGVTCRLVVIGRIPLSCLDDLVSCARSVDVERRGGNGFVSVSLTRVALMMAQGVGCLLRSTDDWGVVAILDPRVVTKCYDGFTMRSLPAMWSTTDPEVVRGTLRRLAKGSDRQGRAFRGYVRRRADNERGQVFI